MGRRNLYFGIKAQVAKLAFIVLGVGCVVRVFGDGHRVRTHSWDRAACLSGGADRGDL